MEYYLLKKTPSKARRDIDQIMRGMGFRNVGISSSPKSNTVIDFFVTLLGVLKAPFVFRKGDILVLPYNLRKYYVFLCKMAHLKGARVITIIHDLSSFYRRKVTKEKEIIRLSHSDYLIAHNPVMKQWLIDNGYRQPIGVLGIFDYLSNKEPKEKHLPAKPYKVLYAGTLSPKKNKFLYDLEDHIQSYKFTLYGNGFDMDAIRKKDCFDYKGFVSSDDLVANADGDFGLVWDGTSIHSCDGPRGEYMKYNNPHKSSLYIRSGLPLIIWDKAALASFVTQNRIGICVSSLTELNSVLSSVTDEDYQEMKKNVLEFSKKLSEGYFFKNAYNEMLSLMNRTH